MPVGSSARISDGRGRERAGDGHALLLAAGQLAGEMRFAMRQPDFGERLARGGEGFVLVEEFERQRHVLDRRHGRHQVEGLEHDADIGGTETGETVLVEAGIVGAHDLYAAAGGAFETGDHHQQGRFARAGRTHHGDGVARRSRSKSMPRRMSTGPARDGSVTCTSSSLMAESATLFQSVIHGRGEQ